MVRVDHHQAVSVAVQTDGEVAALEICGWVHGPDAFINVSAIGAHAYGADLRASGLEGIEGGDGTSTVGCIQQDDPSAEVDLWKG
jgi:hypothetical protein